MPFFGEPLVKRVAGAGICAYRLRFLSRFHNFLGLPVQLDWGMSKKRLLISSLRLSLVVQDSWLRGAELALEIRLFALTEVVERRIAVLLAD